MPDGVKLDRTDLKILTELQANGRITNKALAEKVGISAPPCLRRVRALEEAGLIRAYHAHVEPVALGFEVTVFAMVGLNSQNESDLEAFEAHMLAQPIVRECFMLNGEVDFLLKCVAPDLASFQKFLTSALTPAPHVASVKTSFVIRQAKALPGAPLEMLQQ